MKTLAQLVPNELLEEMITREIDCSGHLRGIWVDGMYYKNQKCSDGEYRIEYPKNLTLSATAKSRIETKLRDYVKEEKIKIY